MMSALLSDVSIKITVLHMIGLSKIIERLTDMTFRRIAVTMLVYHINIFNKRCNIPLILIGLS